MGTGITGIIGTAETTAADNINKINSINNGGSFYLTVILYLVIVCLIIAGYVFFRKYLLKRLGNVKNGTYMKIIDRLVIAQDKQIILIEMKSKIVVVGITQQKMETLAEFEKSDESFGILDAEANNPVSKNNGFFNLLNEKIKTGLDKLNDREKK